MIVKIFQSGKGDSLLISGTKGNVLVDGGVTAAYSQFVSGELNKLQKKKISIDLACVSHIDDDHIGGLLKMIEDMVDWRVYDFHKKNGNTKLKAPKSKRPAEIKEIWHNAFHEIVKDNAGKIENMLAASANVLSASTHPVLKEMGEIAQSKGQAIQLSRRLRPEQLNIPLNKQFGGKLALVRKDMPSIKMGSLKIHVLAPFESDLEKLRREWNDWLATSKEAIKKIKDKVEKDSGFLETNSFPNIDFYTAMATELEPILLSQLAITSVTKELGVREKVTTPNLASIMFLVEEGGKTLLMTGDGHWEDIMKGLVAIKKLDHKKGLHLDVLKVPHHGSEHNSNDEFYHTITADHYVFCGNGLHENPDLDVINALVTSRTSNLALTTEAKNIFTLWFNSSASATSGSAKAVKHMAAVEKLTKGLAKRHKNLKLKFITAGKSFLELKP